ncbi:MAG: hypothetical protein JWO19_4822 [Bryobacterales bacterium]|nr:hypothetical protein [Bryobacterales bacterium]
MSDDVSDDESSKEAPPPPRVTIWIRVRETLTVVLKGPEKGSGHHPTGQFARFVSEERWGLLLVLFLAFVMQLLEYHGWLAGVEGRILDLFLRNTSRSVLSASTSPIVTVEIDDDAYRECFRGTSPLDPETVGAMVTKLANGTPSGRPAVIGIDIVTDSEKQENQAGYERLAEEWKKKPVGEGPAVIWAASGEVAHVEAVSFGWWLLGNPDALIVRPSRVLGRAAEDLKDAPFDWSLPVFPPDEDLRLRRFPRRVQVSNDPLNPQVHPEERASWATMIAEKYCDATGSCSIEKGGPEEVFVSSRVQIGQRFPADKVFGCSTKSESHQGPLWGSLADTLSKPTIVLLGGTFANARDAYETPDGPVPGLRINAYAMQAEIDKATITEAWRPLTILADLLLGSLVVYIFWTLVKVRRMMELCVLSIGGAFLLSALAFWFGQVWLSCIGVVAGVVLHMIVEIYKMDLKKPKHAH